MFKNELKSYIDVAEYQLCCGCGVCAYLSPEKYEIQDIFKFGKRPTCKSEICGPDIDLRAVCPGLSANHDPSVFHQNGLVDQLKAGWGPIFGVWELSATDPEIRFKGSSGGAISALALYCLEKEGMFGALQVALDPVKPLQNKNVLSRTREEIISAAGSRYSPASPCEDMRLIEEAPESCVFIGKPCDVLGARNASKLRPNLLENLGLTIACFCAGTPSTDGTIGMLGAMGVTNPEDVKSLRYRGHGWPGQAFVEFDDGQGLQKSELTYAESWGDMLQKHRPWRCYICPDHTGEFADIAVGDPWFRQINDGEEGASLVLARSQKGLEVISHAIEEGYLQGRQIAPGILPASQPNLLKARGSLWGRVLILKVLGAPCPQYINFPMFKFWWTELSLREKLQSLAGTARRVVRRKLKRRQIMISESNGKK